MTLEEFQKAAGPSPQWAPPLRALWLDAAGKWEAAHQAIQDDEGLEAAWVHAYLHRKEGDDSNAQYWYARASRDFFEGPLEEEWKVITMELLNFSSGASLISAKAD